MHYLSIIHGPAAVSVTAGIGAVLVAALAIRLFFRPKTTPWDA